MQLAVEQLQAAGEACAPLGIVVGPELEGVLFVVWRVSPVARRNRRVASVRGQASVASEYSVTSGEVLLLRDNNTPTHARRLTAEASTPASSVLMGTRGPRSTGGSWPIVPINSGVVVVGVVVAQLDAAHGAPATEALLPQGRRGRRR